MTPREEVILTLLRWSEAGLMTSGVILRAPSGRIAGEYRCVSEVPLGATDPATGQPFHVLVEHVEVYHQLVRSPG